MFDTNLFQFSFFDSISSLMVPYLFASFWTGRWWYAIPLIVSISLVYGATRHEHIVPILVNSYKSAVWILSFMAVIFVVIWLVGISL